MTVMACIPERRFFPTQETQGTGKAAPKLQLMRLVRSAVDRPIEVHVAGNAFLEIRQVVPGLGDIGPGGRIEFRRGAVGKEPRNARMGAAIAWIDALSTGRIEIVHGV